MVVTVILMDYLLAKNSIAAERMIIKSFLEFFAAWRVAEQRTMEKMLQGIKVVSSAERKNYGQADEKLKMDERIRFRKMVGDVIDVRERKKDVVKVAAIATVIFDDSQFAML